MNWKHSLTKGQSQVHSQVQQLRNQPWKCLERSEETCLGLHLPSVWISSRLQLSYLLLPGISCHWHHTVIIRPREGICCLLLMHNAACTNLAGADYQALKVSGTSIFYSNQLAWLPWTHLHKLFQSLLISPTLISFSEGPFRGFSHTPVTVVQAQGEWASKLDASTWLLNAGFCESPPACPYCLII